MIGLVLDVADAAAIRDAYGEAEAKLGAISVSVQNAGVITIARVEDLSETESARRVAEWAAAAQQSATES